MARLLRIAQVGVAGLLGSGLGYVVGGVRTSIYRIADFPFLSERIPLPHHVPEHRGGASFRFAMAHDVLLERYPKHGQAFYRERNRLDLAKLAALPAEHPSRFEAIDDLGVGLERLGKSAEAAALLRDKLEAQRKRGIKGRALYTSHANLGTFLIHSSFAQALAGDQQARDRSREGVELIRESVKLNPEAHFGRERWQLAIAEFLLAAMADPSLLMTFDCLGNRLDLETTAILDREANWVETGYGRAYDPTFARWKITKEAPEFFEPGFPIDDPAWWPKLNPIRRHITKVGAEAGWEAVAVASHRAPVPFDEPVLGIIGMWRQGGGANPHFALALGETMLRVGQRSIAWSAFERASRLSARFWPDPALGSFLRSHCQKRQSQIEETFAEPPRGPASSQAARKGQFGPPDEGATAGRLRSRFEAELDFGESSQRQAQRLEQSKIEAGASIDDPDFLANPPSVASPVGPEEWFVGVPPSRMESFKTEYRSATSLFGAGLAAMGVAIAIRLASAIGGEGLRRRSKDSIQK